MISIKNIYPGSGYALILESNPGERQNEISELLGIYVGSKIGMSDWIYTLWQRG